MKKPQPASQDKAMRVAIDASSSVSAWLRVPKPARACFLEHGAGAGMTHTLVQKVSDGLAERRAATLRYLSPYVERGSKRPDTPTVAHDAVRAACLAARAATGLPLFAGGKSFGGRTTSQAQAIAPFPHVAGLAFLGFPLHPPEKPSSEREEHLTSVHVPMFSFKVRGTSSPNMLECRRWLLNWVRARFCSPFGTRTMVSTCSCGLAGQTRR